MRKTMSPGCRAGGGMAGLEPARFDRVANGMSRSLQPQAEPSWLSRLVFDGDDGQVVGP